MMPLKEDLDQALRRSLEPLPQELNELDWKQGLSDDKGRLKEHLSAFANYPGGGFLVFGIANSGQPMALEPNFGSHIIQKLGNLAATAFDQRVQVSPLTTTYRDAPLVAVYVHESGEKPVNIRGSSIECSFIRSAGQTRRMDRQDLRKAILNSRPLRFEELVPSSRSLGGSLLEMVDTSALLSRLGAGTFSGEDARNDRLVALKILTSFGEGLVPTNLGLLLCSHDLTKVPGYERYAIRVLSYDGDNRLLPAKEKIFPRGYTFSLDAAVGHVIDIIPHSEVIRQASRLNAPVIPEIAIREIIGNAIIHRDYTRSDSYTMIEVFSNRIEVTNPGGLFGEVTVDRLIDHPPRARNEVLADTMKLLNYYEERGSGIDKVVAAMEIHGLPPPDFRSSHDRFTAVLYTPRGFDEMSKLERINAVYQHACLNFVCDRKTTNATVRERFKWDGKKITKAFRLLKEATEAGRIKESDLTRGPKHTHYLPYWA